MARRDYSRIQTPQERRNATIQAKGRKARIAPQAPTRKPHRVKQYG